MFNPNEISNSYAKKIESYDSKYQFGSFTHIHTGLYSESIFKQLLKNESINYDIEYLKYILVRGQDNLVESIQKQIPHGIELILDCGAGHGGTSFYLALTNNCKVHPLTLSEEQFELIKERSKKLYLSDNIFPILGNIFDVSLEQHQYDIIIGTDAFCQMGNPEVLLPKLNAALKPGGRIIINDYFSDDDQFKDYFNNYWKSDVSEIKYFLDKALEAGLTMVELKNNTRNQLLFWKISISHSAKLLEKAQNEEEKNRLINSKKFHKFMYKNFSSEKAQYYSIVLEKKQ